MRPGIKLTYIVVIVLFALAMVAIFDGRDTISFFDSPLTH